MHFLDCEHKRLSPVIGLLTGFLIFIIIYGVRVLNPVYVDWLLGKGDLSQHYLGWEFYRRDVWRFPIGMTNRLAYPIETSVVFTDSIPILAVMFKIFKGILPQYFQYFGLWGILCFGLQGYFSTKIFNLWGLDYRCSFVGNIFIITAPVMIHRMYIHSSLGGQWIILIAIYLFFMHDNQFEHDKMEIWHWGILGFLIAGIHLYFFPMCFLFAVGSVIKKLLKYKKMKFEYIAPVISYVLGACGNFYILGGFSSHTSGSAQGFGEFSINLNSFINPNGFSRLMPNLNSAGRYEDFAYLGLGAICMSIICILVYIFGRRMKNMFTYNHIIVIFICFISLIMATFPTITFGDKVLLNIRLPEKIVELFAIFRATGRLIWPMWYCIVLYCIRGIAHLNNKINVCVLALCLAIQIIDISSVLTSCHETYANEQEYEYSDADFWQQMSEYRNFKCVCFSYLGTNNEDSIQMGALALKYNWLMNAFEFARDIDGIFINQSVLEREDARADCIYVFHHKQQELMEDKKHVLRYYDLGELVIGITWLDDDGNVNDFSYE